jgi:hypothetical protein
LYGGFRAFNQFTSATSINLLQKAGEVARLHLVRDV